MVHKLKVTHLSWSLGMGGIESMLVNIANAQASLGNSVTIIIVNDLYDESLLKRISPFVKVVLLNRHSGSKNPLPLFRLNYYLLKINPDVIHCHVGSLISIVASFFYHKCYFTRHSVSSQTDLNKQLLLKYKKVFAISEAVRQDIWEKYQVEAVVVNNGINTKEIERREYRIVANNNPVKLITVGRVLLPVKGQDIILMALKKIKGYNITLDVIGDGPDMAKLREMTDKYGLQSKVNILGSQTQSFVFSHLKDYDVFVMASRTEGFGLTVAEAMAAKLPVVVSDIEGPMEIVCDGKYGHVFRSGDSESCANAIMSVIDHYDTEESINTAYQHVVDNYSVDRTAFNYIENYLQYD